VFSGATQDGFEGFQCLFGHDRAASISSPIPFVFEVLHLYYIIKSIKYHQNHELSIGFAILITDATT
jgi:hypothetical protein